MAIQHNRSMQNLATELGFITIYWGWIEDALDALITFMAEIEHQQMADAITGNVDVRQKVQTLKALFFLRQDASGELYREAISALNTLDNDLRLKRNRYVHGLWLRPKGITTLQKKTVKISKAQAFMPEELKTLDRGPVKIGELRDFRKRLIATVRVLVELLAYQQDRHFYASQRISFLQFRSQVTFGTRPTRIHSKRLSRPESQTRKPRARQPRRG